MHSEVEVQELIDFIKENENRIYKFAYGYVKNEDTALDVVHESIVKAIQKRNTIQKKAYIKTWFYRIVINESLSFLRKKKRILLFEEIDEVEQIDKHRQMVDQGSQIDLYDAIDKLPPKLKTIILLRFFEGMSLEEISQTTHTNLSTTKSRLYKALELLKIKMEGERYD